MKKDMMRIWGLFFISLFVVLGIWKYSRNITLAWGNVPPVPSIYGAKASSLGDAQMSYRYLGLMLQFFGNTSGRYAALSEYNYESLGAWFTLLDELDNKSEFLPFLVSYYFSASQDVEKISPVVDYLEKAGERQGLRKWRWLTQAVYLARYKLNDTEHALRLAQKLRNHPDPDVGTWARHLQSVILSATGEKQAALSMALSLLKDNASTMHPKEIAYLTNYICSELVDKNSKTKFAMCQH